MAAREQRNDSDLDHILVPVEGSLQNEVIPRDNHDKFHLNSQ